MERPRQEGPRRLGHSCQQLRATRQTEHEQRCRQQGKGEAKGQGKTRFGGKGKVFTCPPAARPLFATGGGRGGGRSGNSGPWLQSDFEVGKVVVVGSFRPRTRYQTAHDECLAIFRLLGFDPEEIVQEFLSGGARVR